MPPVADTLKSTRFPSTSTTSTVVHTSWPAGVAAKVLYIYRSADGAFTCTQKRSYGIELSVFIIRIIAGVASTCGKYGVALNRSARWSGYTRNVWRPNVLVAAGKAANLVGERRHSQLSGPRAPFFAPLGLRAGSTLGEQRSSPTRAAAPPTRRAYHGGLS